LFPAAVRLSLPGLYLAFDAFEPKDVFLFLLVEDLLDLVDLGPYTGDYRHFEGVHAARGLLDFFTHATQS
jgi:hypothetical protein